MRTTATLLLLIAIGCGGARENSREPTEAMSPTASTATDSPTDESAAAAAPAEPSAAPESAAIPAAASTPATTVAKAEVRLLSGDRPLGTMTFERKDKMVSISGQFSGLKKGQNALYIHTKGDCSDKGRKIGGHLNPTASKHGPPASSARHAGDFGDLTFDKAGNASFAMETDSITLEPGGPDSVVGRAVVIHSRKDNKKGSAGSPIACGVVVLEGAPDQTRSTYTPAATVEPTSAAR
jgi:Cu-Zn family superoxide dismutase